MDFKPRSLRGFFLNWNLRFEVTLEGVFEQPIGEDFEAETSNSTNFASAKSARRSANLERTLGNCPPS